MGRQAIGRAPGGSQAEFLTLSHLQTLLDHIYRGHEAVTDDCGNRGSSGRRHWVVARLVAAQQLL